MIVKRFVRIIFVLFFGFVNAFFFPCCSVENEEKQEPAAAIISEDSFNGQTFPFIYVDVKNGQEIESKEYYLDCSVGITNTEEKYTYSGANKQSAKIKGRGNSSWNMPKKSYKLKFDSKIDLFGFGKAKKYTLIANYCDKSLSRNFLAYEIAREIGLDQTTMAKPINLFVNGQYNGVYLLCEQVEIGKNRVNIESDLSDIDTGYLVEIDGRAEGELIKGVDYFEIGTKKYVIKDPETDDEQFSPNHFSFIKSYFQECLDALDGGDYERVSELVDVESFAKCYIVHEMFNCIDVGSYSFYLYKKKGDKLFAGPVWDFDISSGNCDYATQTNRTNYMHAKTASVWYGGLLKFDEFKTLVAEFIGQYKEDIVAKIDDVVDYQLEYNQNNSVNFEVWPILGKYVWPNPREIVSINTFEGQLEYVQNWLKEKLEFMCEYYCQE